MAALAAPGECAGGDYAALASAPVDLLYSAHGIRARRIPGMVDLAARRAIMPSIVEPGEMLAAAIEMVVAGDPSPLTPLKIDAVAGEGVACACGDHALAARADLALGPNLGLVLEDNAAFFCFKCGLLRFPDSGEELRRRLSDWHSPRAEPDRAEPSLRYETDRHPRAVQIEITTRCNLACKYCSHALLKSPADLDWATFERTIDRIDFAAVDVVDFTGLGEATLSRLLPAMISEVARRGPQLSLRLVSNAVAASSDRWSALIDAGLTSIALSIDTLDPERFARQRGGASLAKALRTAEALAVLRARSTRRFGLRIKAVLLDDVYREAEALLRWSIATGLDMPQFSTLDRRDTVQSLYRGVDWLAHALVGEGEAEAFERWAQDYWRSQGGAAAPGASRPLRYRHPMLEAEPRLCRWAVDATYIAARGDILTCCESMIDLPRQAVGSVADHSLEAAWQEELLWNYRLPLSLGRPPRGCVGCPQAPAAAQLAQA